MDNLIQDLDYILDSFIKGKLKTTNYDEYLILSEIATTINKHRKPVGVTVQRVDFDD